MKDYVIKHGIILGLISIVISLLAYIIDFTLFAKWWFGLSLLLVYLILITIFGIKYRNEEHDGYLNFKGAFLYSFLVFVVVGVLGLIFNMILFNVVDPDLPQKITDATVENTIAMMERFGVPEEQLDETVQEIRKSTPENFSPLGQAKTFLYGLIFYAVLSLITGAIIKKKEPEEELR